MGSAVFIYCATSGRGLVEASLIVAIPKLEELAATIHRCAMAVHRFVRLTYFLGIARIQTRRLWPLLGIRLGARRRGSLQTK
jgi:hypothetical protein